MKNTLKFAARKGEVTKIKHFAELSSLIKKQDELQVAAEKISRLKGELLCHEVGNLFRKLPEKYLEQDSNRRLKLLDQLERGDAALTEDRERVQAQRNDTTEQLERTKCSLRNISQKLKRSRIKENQDVELLENEEQLELQLKTSFQGDLDA